MRRKLFIDEDLNRRIPIELRKRGHKHAQWMPAAGFQGFKDPQLIRGIATLDAEAVLVTGDFNMPATHAAVISKTRLTLAIIDPVHPPEYSHDEWDREVVHKWAHKMEEQERGSIRIYTVRGSREWKPRRRPRVVKP